MPVSVFLIVIAAAGMTAPVASVTVPVIVADPDSWQNPAVGKPIARAISNTKAAEILWNKLSLFIYFPPKNTCGRRRIPWETCPASSRLGVKTNVTGARHPCQENKRPETSQNYEFIVTSDSP